MILLLAALEQEISGLRRRLALVPEEVPGVTGSAYAGQHQHRPVLLARTGMGRQRAEATCEAVLARYPVTTVISMGFSGALEEWLSVGDLVLASELMGIAGPGGNEIEPAIYEADEALLHTVLEALAELPRATPLRLVSAPTVTTPGIVGTRADKEALGWRTRAIAVDMESYWVARAAAARGLPFLALRVISDALADCLPAFDQILNAGGVPRTGRLVAHLVREPASLVALARLARNAGRARRALTAGVVCSVAAL